MKRTNELLECYRMMHKYLTTVQNTVLLQKEITKYQLNVLLEIKHARHINLQDLSDQLCHEKSTISRTVESLRQAGYLSAVKTAEDRRTLDLTLTGKGTEFLSSYQKEIDQYYRRVLAELPEEEQDRIVHGVQILKKSFLYNFDRIQQEDFAAKHR